MTAKRVLQATRRMHANARLRSVWKSMEKKQHLQDKLRRDVILSEQTVPFEHAHPDESGHHGPVDLSEEPPGLSEEKKKDTLIHTGV